MTKGTSKLDQRGDQPGERGRPRPHAGETAALHDRGVSGALEGDALIRLLAWFSPAYPTGAYTYSHGLEYAVEAGLVTGRASTEAWVSHILRHGSGFVDAALFAEAWRHAGSEDRTGLDELIGLAAAWRGTAEMALESAQQGRSFLDVTRAAWPDPRLDALAGLAAGRPLALPVAAGYACGLAGVPLPAALTFFLHAVAANLVSAAVRLIPLGQTDGQRALAALARPVQDCAARAAATPLEEVGSAAPMVDWTSMQHETQYTRLFRS